MAILLWIYIQQHQIVVGLERIYFLVKTTSFIRMTFHSISPIVESFRKKNYTESAELQEIHNSKKQMDTLMERHDLPSEIKVQEIGKAQDRYILFRNRLKSDQSVKSKGILEPKNISLPESTIFVPDNIEAHDSSFNVERSSE